MLTHDRSKRKAASLCHESLRYILYIIWGSLTNLKIAFFLHQRYTKLHHSKVWNIQTREMNTAFSSHNVTGFKGYLPRSPSSYPVRVVWNDNEAEIIYMLSTRGAKRGSNYRPIARDVINKINNYGRHLGGPIDPEVAI